MKHSSHEKSRSNSYSLKKSLSIFAHVLWMLVVICFSKIMQGWVYSSSCYKQPYNSGLFTLSQTILIFWRYIFHISLTLFLIYPSLSHQIKLPSTWNFCTSLLIFVNRKDYLIFANALRINNGQYIKASSFPQSNYFAEWGLNEGA